MGSLRRGEAIYGLYKAYKRVVERKFPRIKRVCKVPAR